MMGWHNTMMYPGSESFFWLGQILGLLTWGLVIAVLLALFRWLWKKGGK